MLFRSHTYTHTHTHTHITQEHIYRGYQRPRSQNGYRNTNFQPRPFLQNQQQFNNYRPMGQQQYNNYPRYRNQDQYMNQQRNHQRNDGRRSQSGYQQRPFFNNSKNNPNMETLGPRLTGYKPPYRDWETDRKSTRLNSSHSAKSRMPSSA